MWGCDKPGLLSEITRLLVDNKLDLSNALVWTHKTRFAMILSLGEPMKGKEAKELQHYLMTSLEGAEELSGTGELRIQVKPEVPERHLERRLHSLMIQNEPMEELEAHAGVDVDIYFEHDSGYTVVRVESPDRPRLMFDTVCTLAETFVDVIHGCVEVKEGLYSQEYFAKHSNGDCITSEKHMLLLKQHLVASAVRRNPTGLKVEVTCQDRVGPRGHHEGALQSGPECDAGLGRPRRNARDLLAGDVLRDIGLRRARVQEDRGAVLPADRRYLHRGHRVHEATLESQEGPLRV